MIIVRTEASTDEEVFDVTQKELPDLGPVPEAAILDLLTSNVKDTNKSKSGGITVVAKLNGRVVATASNLGKSEYRRIEDRIIAGFKKFRT